MKPSSLNYIHISSFKKQLRSHSASELSGHYYRKLLIGGGIIVSVALLAAATAGVMMLVEEFFVERKHDFLAQTELVKVNLVRYQSRLRQTVEAYEILRDLRDHDQIPISLYRQRLQQHQGVLVTKPDIAAVPIAILSSIDHLKNDAQLSMLFHLAREISPSALLRERDTGYSPGGFIYTPDRSLLALMPAPSSQQLDIIRFDKVDQIIDSYVKGVEDAIANIPADVLRKQRMVWVPLYKSPITGEMVGQFAVPVYNNDQRIAVVVASMPFGLFPQLFQDSTHEPGFFILARDHEHFYGVDESDSRENRWVKVILSFSDALDQKGARPEIRYRQGVFFLSQFISGPEWTAVYAFDWYTVLVALQGKLSLILFLTLSVLGLLWVFIVLLDRLVLEPLRVQTRLVFESEAFNRAVLNTAPVGLTVYDPLIDNIVMQNEAAKNLLASSSEGISLYHRLLSAHSWTNSINQFDITTKENEVRRIETSVVTESGQRREISVAFSKTRYQQREVILFGLTDISEQKTTVRLLQRAREAADQANQAKSMFLAMMSHEIRTPLHGALGNLELLAMEELPQRQKERVSTIRRAFDALLTLINDILDLSKIEAQEMLLHSEKFRLDELIERCAQTFAPVIMKKNLRFLCLIDPQLTGSWNGDLHRLSQVLMNLLSNALKFTESGSITLRAIPGEVSDGVIWARISVSDTGIGISESQIKKVFEPFVQADRSIASRFGGTGLGLTLCSRIMTLMGGTITVDSEEGEGSIFTVNVPLNHDGSIDADAPSVVPDSYEFSTVVVVCDSPLWQLTLVSQIKYWFPDVKVVEAESTTPSFVASDQAIIVFATSLLIPGIDWEGVMYSYLDRVILSAEGPPYPERDENKIYVTSLSMTMLKLALIACGKQGKTLQPITTSNKDLVIHHDINILIAEDDPLNRSLLEQQLFSLGYYNVDSVGDGKQALERCLISTYEIIITDLGMPFMDGKTFLQQIRSKGIDTPVIVSTADINGDIQVKASSFADVLHKPITMERLKTALEKVLDASMRPTTRAVNLTPPLKITALHTLFLDCWENDEYSLRESLASNNSKSFLGRLHRLKGAMLILNEKPAIEACEDIERKVSLHGVLLSQQSIDALLKMLEELVKKYKKSSLEP